MSYGRKVVSVHTAAGSTVEFTVNAIEQNRVEAAAWVDGATVTLDGWWDGRDFRVKDSMHNITGVRNLLGAHFDEALRAMSSAVDEIRRAAGV